MLCTFSFIFSIVSIVGATIVLMQVATSDRGYFHGTYIASLVFFCLAFLTGGASGLVGALSFLEFGYGVTTLVVLSLCLALSILSITSYIYRQVPLQLEKARIEWENTVLEAL